MSTEDVEEALVLGERLDALEERMDWYEERETSRLKSEIVLMACVVGMSVIVLVAWLKEAIW